LVRSTLQIQRCFACLGTASFLRGKLVLELYLAVCKLTTRQNIGFRALFLVTAKRQGKSHHLEPLFQKDLLVFFSLQENTDALETTFDHHVINGRSLLFVVARDFTELKVRK
jgi:hypothetical protein